MDNTKELQNLTDEKDALDQSVALNRIVLNVLDESRKSNLLTKIILLISILVNVAICCIFISYENQFTTEKTVTTTTVVQDTEEGTGNNVYQAGENSTYSQTEYIGDLDNGETSNTDNHSNNTQKSEWQRK